MEEKDMILYEDAAILVCHKPEGVPVQSARLGQKDMVSILNNYLAEKRAARKAQPSERRPLAWKGREAEQIYVVHRLDQPVEGVIVFAKTKKAAAGLTRQITQGSMEKVYYAVCRVTEQAPQEFLQGQETELVDDLVKDGRTNTSRIAEKGEKDAKRAQLWFRTVEQYPEEGQLLVEIHLGTGRHHQIRVQMAHAGLPLLGDGKYDPKGAAESGADSLSGAEKEASGSVDRMRAAGRIGTAPALCAAALSFEHPITGKRMQFRVKPQKEAFRRLGTDKFS